MEEIDAMLTDLNTQLELIPEMSDTLKNIITNFILFFCPLFCRFIKK